MIDAVLLAPAQPPPHELAARLPPDGTAALVERVRRRAISICRRARPRADSIVTARDALTLALYARATPRGGFTA